MSKRFGRWLPTATPVTPKFLSLADPAARWTGAHGGQAVFADGTGEMLGRPI